MDTRHVCGTTSFYKGGLFLEPVVLHIWPADDSVTLTLCNPEPTSERRPVVIVIPGGAYIAQAQGEAEPVAERFAQMGYLGCVLRQSTLYKDFQHTDGEPNPHCRFPEPLQQLAAAIKLLRAKADSYALDPERVILMGFSAGGHLAANYANLWADPEVLSAGNWTSDEIRPNALVLCYAATELGVTRHSSMLRAVFGTENVPQDKIDRYNPKNTVKAGITPPVFLWHTADDPSVSVWSSYHMAQALQEKGVVCETHIFSSGPHASATADGLPAYRWPELADDFLKAVL